VKRLEASGAKVRVWDLNGAPEVDVADASSIKKATEDALKELGKVDVLVKQMQASQDQNVPPWIIPSRSGSVCCASNLTSQFLCCRAVAPHMVKAGYGRIVNIASIAGKEGIPTRWRILRPRPGSSGRKDRRSSQSAAVRVHAGGGLKTRLATR